MRNPLGGSYKTLLRYFSENFNAVCVLSSDAASYVQKRHRDMYTFDSVCAGMTMEMRCASTVSPSGWYSFYLALVDILNYWRAIVAFLKSEAVKEKKKVES